MKLHPETINTMMSMECKITRERTRKEFAKTKKTRQKKRCSRINAEFTLRTTMNGMTVSKIQKTLGVSINVTRTTRQETRKEKRIITPQKEKKKDRQRHCYYSDVKSDVVSILYHRCQWRTKSLTK